MNQSGAGMTTSTVTRPRRRFWRLSVRGLMVLVLVVGGVLGWQARRASVQRRAVAQLVAEGIGTSFDYEYDSEGTYLVNSRPRAPGWLRRAVGDEWFRELASVDVYPGTLKAGKLSESAIRAAGSLDRLDKLRVYNVPLTDDEFSRMLSLSRPRQILFQETEATPAALRRIASLGSVNDLTVRFKRPVCGSSCLPALTEMTRLKRLWLTNLESFPPEEMVALRSLCRLEALLIKNSPGDESCLEHIRGLTALKSLVLQQTKVTDKGLKRLAPLRTLEELLVDGSEITDSGLSALAGWPMLTNLSLYLDSAWSSSTLLGGQRAPRGCLTDAGLVTVAKASGLKHLALSGSRFSDIGLAALSQLPALADLDLNGVEVTTDGVRKLLAAHQFESLELSGPTVADEWLPLLANQKRLVLLSLQGPRITDAGMAAVVAQPTASYLDFSGSSLTDRGLATLAASTCPYRLVSVRGTKVTEAGVAAFRSAKPRCKLIWEPVRTKD